MINAGIVIFDGVEELDFIGPFEVLSYVNKIKDKSLEVKLIHDGASTVTAFNGLRVIPDASFSECKKLDVLIVPGGRGRLKAMYDEKILTFVKGKAKGTMFTASVCTGAFILANAGLLDGKYATTYHSAVDELKNYAAIKVVDAKVVHDGQVLTAAGVSSGLELGFYLVKLLFGSEIAQKVAVGIEYAVDVDNINVFQASI